MPRDYEMETAVAAVEQLVTEPIERALVVGSPGSQAGTPGKALMSLFGKSRRESDIATRNVVVLTPTQIRVFACSARSARPIAKRDVVSWPRHAVHVGSVPGEQWSAFNASDSGSVTNFFYVITFTPDTGGPPVVVECPRTDSARVTIHALEDATGSRPSRITAQRRKRQAPTATHE